MAPTIVDLDDAMLAGQARAQEWEAEFQEQFYGPMLMAQALMQFLSLPPEALAQMQAEDGAMFEQLGTYAKRMKGVMGRGKENTTEVPAEEGNDTYQEGSPAPAFQSRRPAANPQDRLRSG